MIEFNNLERVLQEYAKDVKTLYKDNLKSDDARASGDLINSVQWILEANKGTYIVSLSLAEYWKYVEYGRKPGGKFPPFNKIKEWIKIKPILPQPYNGKLPTINQLTYLISRKIAAEGIKPRNLLSKTLEEINSEYDEKISEAITQDIAEHLNEILVIIDKRI